jgi:hypothetical protein
MDAKSQNSMTVGNITLRRTLEKQCEIIQIVNTLKI